MLSLAVAALVQISPLRWQTPIRSILWIWNVTRIYQQFYRRMHTWTLGTPSYHTFQDYTWQNIAGYFSTGFMLNNTIWLAWVGCTYHEGWERLNVDSFRQCLLGLYFRTKDCDNQCCNIKATTLAERNCIQRRAVTFRIWQISNKCCFSQPVFVLQYYTHCNQLLSSNNTKQDHDKCVSKIDKYDKMGLLLLSLCCTCYESWVLRAFHSFSNAVFMQY